MPKTRKRRDRGERDWYQLGAWRHKAKHQLSIEPLCVMCLDRGVITAATIADHIVPHGGDKNAFWTGRLQSLCETCHNRDKRRIENGNPPITYGSDGWPIP